MSCGKWPAADRTVAHHDSISLCRDQHVQLYGGDGALRMIVDHPSNSPLIGICTGARLVRAADVAVQDGDGTVAVYCGRAGAARRIATAATVHCKNGSIGLTDWRMEPGFEHACDSAGDAAVHRIMPSGSRSG